MIIKLIHSFAIGFWILICIINADTETRWRLPTNQHALIPWKSAKFQDLYASTDTNCAIIATRLQWPNLFCYAENICRVSDLQIIPLKNGNINIQQYSDNCYTTVDPKGKLYM